MQLIQFKMPIKHKVFIQSDHERIIFDLQQI